MYYLVLKFVDHVPNYIAGYNTDGSPIFTKNKDLALKYDFETASKWFHKGYTVSKRR